MKTYNLSDAKARFSAVVEEAAAGEEIIVTKMGKPVVKVVSYRAVEEGVRLGALKGKIKVAPDFDEWPNAEARSLGIID